MKKPVNLLFVLKTKNEKQNQVVYSSVLVLKQTNLQVFFILKLQMNNGLFDDTQTKK